MLAPHKISDVSAFEDDLLEIAGELRKIRSGMAEKGIEEIKLESAKARLFVDYLKEWAIASEARFRQQRDKAAAQATRDRVKKERSEGKR